MLFQYMGYALSSTSVVLFVKDESGGGIPGSLSWKGKERLPATGIWHLQSGCRTESCGCMTI